MSRCDTSQVDLWSGEPASGSHCRRKSRWCFVGLLLACLAAEVSPQAVAGEVYTIDKALSRLRGDPPAMIGEGLRAEMSAWLYDVGDDIRYLSRSPADIDERLTELTREPFPLPVRLRAAVALMARDSERGPAAVASWATSEAVVERLACWVALQRCTDNASVDRHLSPQSILAAYRREANAQVRQEIESYFYWRKAAFAVDDLCRTIEDPKYRGSVAVAALGNIGDRRAVKSIIKSSADVECVVDALGRLGGDEALESLFAHSNLRGVGRALGDTKDPRAIPVLKRRLESLEAQVRKNKEGHGRDAGDFDWLEDEAMETRVALLLLTSDKPAQAIMDIVESKEIKSDLRRVAMYGLRRQGIQPVRERVLALYRVEQSSEIGRECIRLLADCPGDDVTEALLAHLKAVYSSRSPQAVTLLETAERAPLIELLHSALHARIGNRLFDIISRYKDESDYGNAGPVGRPEIAKGGATKGQVQ